MEYYMQDKLNMLLCVRCPVIMFVKPLPTYTKTDNLSLMWVYPQGASLPTVRG